MRTSIVLLAAGEPWESAVLTEAQGADVLVLKRCVDLTDLLATASLGQAQVAVVSAAAPRLDAEAIGQLRSHDLEVVAVGPAEHADRIARLGASRLVGAEAAAVLAAVVDVVAARSVLRVAVAEPAAAAYPGPRGRVVAVWGPAGAPGRTTVALGIAAEAAAAGGRIVLVDADPYGGCVAARLGVLDEASGLLAAARSCNAGTLDRVVLAAACRRAAANLDVLTGLPRADRRIEVRPGVMTGIVEVATELGDVVVDTGFSLEDGDRDRMTTESLALADEIVVVGLADPVGLGRLARALVDLREFLGGSEAQLRVVINRFRSGNRWSAEEVVAFLQPYLDPLAVRVIPEDGRTLDLSLASGRTLVELGTSEVRTAVVPLAADCFPAELAEVRPKRRKATRARRR